MEAEDIWQFSEVMETFKNEAEDYGVTVKEGTGKITMDGKEFDISKAVEEIFHMGNRMQNDEDYYWEVIRKNSEETGINIMDYME